MEGGGFIHRQSCLGCPWNCSLESPGAGIGRLRIILGWDLEAWGGNLGGYFSLCLTWEKCLWLLVFLKIDLGEEGGENSSTVQGFPSHSLLLPPSDPPFFPPFQSPFSCSVTGIIPTAALPPADFLSLAFPDGDDSWPSPGSLTGARRSEVGSSGMVDRDSKQAGREDWEYLLDVAVPSLGAKWLQERAPVPPNLSLKEPEGFGSGI